MEPEMSFGIKYRAKEQSIKTEKWYPDDSGHPTPRMFSSQQAAENYIKVLVLKNTIKILVYRVIPCKGGKPLRGFALMRWSNKDKLLELARVGGKTVHNKGTAHKWDREHAKEAGRKGGKVMQDRRRAALAYWSTQSE